MYTVYVSRYYTGYEYYVYMPCMVFILYICIYMYLYIYISICASVRPFIHPCMCVLCVYFLFTLCMYLGVTMMYALCVSYLCILCMVGILLYVYICVFTIYINLSVHPPMHVLCVYTMYL